MAKKNELPIQLPEHFKKIDLEDKNHEEILKIAGKMSEVCGNLAYMETLNLFKDPDFIETMSKLIITSNAFKQELDRQVRKKIVESVVETIDGDFEKNNNQSFVVDTPGL